MFWPLQGHIEEVPEESEKGSEDGNPDWTPDPDPDTDQDLDPNPNPKPWPWPQIYTNHPKPTEETPVWSYQKSHQVFPNSQRLITCHPS